MLGGAMRFDYHMHTPLCQHAEGHPREYVQAGLAKGLQEIGFSDHNPMTTPFDEWRMAPDELPKYLAMIEEARAEYPQIPVRIGLECDFLPGCEEHIRFLSRQAGWDYFIGSVHYILPDWDVDSPFKRHRWKDHPVDDVWKMYFECYTRMACSGLFDFLGHPDLVKKFGDKPAGDLMRFYKETLDALEAHDQVIELSTAGLRKEVKEMYPSRQFLEEALRRGIPILVNSDAHKPEEVGYAFDEAYALLREVGYKELVRFEKRQRISVPIG